MSQPVVSEYLRDFSAKGQRDLARGTTSEKREMGGVTMEEDDPRQEGRDGT